MDEPESYKICKLSLSLSLWKALSFYPHAKMQISPFEVEVVCTEFIGKMISHQRESNAIRSPLIMKHMYLLRSFAPSTASHTCHKLLAEICEIRLIFRGDLTKFCEIFIRVTFKLTEISLKPLF